MNFQCTSNGIIIHEFRFHVDKNIPFPNIPCSIGHALMRRYVCQHVARVGPTLFARMRSMAVYAWLCMLSKTLMLR
jgi:hypothetical protein